MIEETANDRKNRLRREARAAAALAAGKVLRAAPNGKSRVENRKAKRAAKNRAITLPKIKKGEPAYRRLMQLKFGLTRPETKAEMNAILAQAVANTAAMRVEDGR